LPVGFWVATAGFLASYEANYETPPTSNLRAFVPSWQHFFAILLLLKTHSFLSTFDACVKSIYPQKTS